jgi:hypothetical protein
MPAMSTSHNRPRRFLVAPLDWGLGHATRCIPIIRRLLALDREVVIGGSGPHVNLLIEEFPSLEVVPLVNYGISYASNSLLLAVKFPLMPARVCVCAAREYLQTREIVKKHTIDVIISDQRFGCRNPGVESIYVTHQLCLKMPRGFGALEPLFGAALRWAAERFDRVWIPDVPGSENLTGELTRRFPRPRSHRFVGPLSRIPEHPAGTPSHSVELLVTLSGPEPQRTILEKRILISAATFPGRIVLLRGKPAGGLPAPVPSNVSVREHCRAGEAGELMRGARAVVCRGGYSTIMELVRLRKPAVLVPTPGQTEQEYLCARMEEKRWFATASQSGLDLREAVHTLESGRYLPPRLRGGDLLGEALEEVATADSSGVAGGIPGSRA